jgi:hypothetical protein
MVSLTAIFGMFVILFGVIGAMRGWAKELLVTSAIVLGLFINAILETHIVAYRDMLFLQSVGNQFLIRGGVIVLMAILGYQTPHISSLQPRMVRERLEEVVLGLFLGLLNGYLLVGTVWFYLHQADYPTSLIIIPAAGSELADQIANLIVYMPPAILTIPYIYFAVGVVFVFIIAVFV